jgi:dihydroorotase
MRMLIKGGRVIDPGTLDAVMDIYVADGVVREIRPPAAGSPDGAADTGRIDTIIDAAGLVVTPGLVDMHVHLREPGHEYKETVASGCRAAVSGGITAVCCMPNTNPVNDRREVTEFILHKAALANTARVYPAAAISLGLRGDSLSEFGDLKAAGAVAVTDDGHPVTDSQLMRRALEYARGTGLLVISHCENLDLVGSGVMNESPFGTRMGLAGIPNAAESVMVIRDIELAALTGSRLHIAHVSTRESVHAIREAKKQGIPVTAETAPHYFTLTDEAVGAYNTNAKMNPPLRSRKDLEAIREGLADGTIDAIATDHAPHSSIEKDVEFDRAANGIIGLETSVSLSLRLVEDRVLSLSELVEKMATGPARILGVPCGLVPGNPADITLIDPERMFTVDSATFKSLSRNTPFDGLQVKGAAVVTVVGGNVVYDAMSV